MKVAVAVAALLWVAAGGASPAPHLRRQRNIDVPAGGGAVCAVLDAQVLAHAASRSGDDLRVFRQAAAGEIEVPFVLTESEAEPEDAAEATVRDVKARGSEIEFDLMMPHRVYSSVVLKMAARNFVGRALVTAKGSGKVLGSFAVFDLTGEGLARSTTLALAETTQPVLHVRLRMASASGRPFHATAEMVQGAEVSASREAQTLYTVVAATRAVQVEQGGVQRAELTVPAHVPVERVSVVLDPGFRGEFARELRVGGVGTSAESVKGSIWRVKRGSVAGLPAISAESLGMDAVLGLTLRDAAKFDVAIGDGQSTSPLPVREVRLEMRQRSVCFAAEAGARYVLRYGDAALQAPVYTQMRSMEPSMALATLGPESESAGFHAETATGRTQRRAGVVWVVGLGGMVLIWAGAGSLVRRRSGKV